MKALALGATACMTGRTYLYALGAGGQRGVEFVIDQLGAGMQRTMSLDRCGVGRGDHVRAGVEARMKVVDLRTEKAVDPIGLGVARARVCRGDWRPTAARRTSSRTRGRSRSATATTSFGTRDASTARAQLARYAGPPLGSRASRWWRVRAWTSAGETAWSDRASFELGLLEPSDWSARMITRPRPPRRWSGSRRRSTSATTSTSARLYVTSHGLVDASINGTSVVGRGARARVDELQPAARGPDARRHSPRAARDATRSTRSSPRAGSAAASGSASGKQVYGTHVGLLRAARGHDDGRRAPDRRDRRHVDGRRRRRSPRRRSTTARRSTRASRVTAPRAGRHRGARRVRSGGRSSRRPFRPSAGPRRSRRSRGRSSATASCSSTSDRTSSGGCGSRCAARPTGAEIVMRHAEVLGPDGRLFTAPLRTAKATDTYIAAGDDVEIYEPPLHVPRVPLRGDRGHRSGRASTSKRSSSTRDLERTGTFECWRRRSSTGCTATSCGDSAGNFVSVPTDCPQRDERLGWTGDAQVFSPTASFLFDCETFWENWLADLAADQRDDGCVPPSSRTSGIGDRQRRVRLGRRGGRRPVDDVRGVRRRHRARAGDAVDDRVGRLGLRRGSTRSSAGRRTSSSATGSTRTRRRASRGRRRRASTSSRPRTRRTSTDLLARAARVLGDDDDRRSGSRERFATIREAWWKQLRRGRGDDADRLRAGDRVRPRARRRARRRRSATRSRSWCATPATTSRPGSSARRSCCRRSRGPATSTSRTTSCSRGRAGLALHGEGRERRRSGSGGTRCVRTARSRRKRSARAGRHGGGMVSFNHYAYGCVADWMHRTRRRPRPSIRTSPATAT